VSADLTTVRGRWWANRESPTRNDVRDEDFANAVDHFEPQAPEEHALCYDGSLPLKDWIAQHFRPVA
jgi:hypothetical protein